MVICLERGADLHMAQLMPLPLTVSCFCKIQIGFTFLVLAHPGSPRQRVIKGVCVCIALEFLCKWLMQAERLYDFLPGMELAPSFQRQLPRILPKAPVVVIY